MANGISELENGTKIDPVPPVASPKFGIKNDEPDGMRPPSSRPPECTPSRIWASAESAVKTVVFPKIGRFSPKKRRPGRPPPQPSTSSRPRKTSQNDAARLDAVSAELQSPISTRFIANLVDERL
ncbi:hypothetical protein GWI33_005012 [Rhynchophorus ferrugineus]|uniref:Uncharacterized protein n=1 Tax=Rhynchophorus ferrugineus TaxID=354439 RepID=A0A834IHH4_RHYFE|nr:hypothetical protein GWI33_005012 [Rhynchophorus ferrugineus]